MKRQLHLLFSCLLAFVAAGAEPSDLRVVVEEVTEKRTTGKFFAGCEVKLKFLGDAMAGVAGASAIKVTKAEDDLGRDLRKEDKDDPTFEQRETDQDALSMELSLRTPSRNAKAIRTIEGEITLLKPTEANGGLAVLKGVLNQNGKWLDSAALSNANVRIMYLTRETFDAKKKEMEAAKKAGNKVAEKFGEAFGEFFSGVFSGFSGEGGYEVRFLIQDSENRLARLSLHDAEGVELKTSGSMRSGSSHSYTLRSAPAAGLQAKVFLRVPGAEQRFPFKLEQIVLP